MFRGREQKIVYTGLAIGLKIQVKQLFVLLAQYKDIVYRYVLHKMTPGILQYCGWMIQ
jgi:hypothetical protein